MVSGANVTITNEQTAGKYTAATNERGEFTVGFLPVGVYTVEVQMPGFKSFRETGLRLAAGQELRYPVALQLGEVSEQVTVTGEAPIIQNVNPTIVKTFLNEQVKELPLSQRDWTRLLYIDPGARRGDQNVTFNGLASRGNTITVDGTEASGDIEQPTLSFYQNFNVIKTVSLEAIQEVQLTKGVMTAETGLAFGANVNLVTKQGTNEPHGSVFYNWQNNILNARNLFNPKPQPMAPVRFHQFGGSMGGPIIKDKLFLFGVFEGYRDRNSSISSDRVFTREFRDTAIARVPAYKPYFDRIALPTDPYAPGANEGIYRAAMLGSRSDNHMVLRGDYRISGSNSLTSRYTRGRPESYGQPTGGNSTLRKYLGVLEAVTTSFTHFAPTWSGETRVGINRTYFRRIDTWWESKVARINITGLPSPGGGGGLLQGGWTWSIEQVLSKNRGRHSVKSGFLFRQRAHEREDDRIPTVSYLNLDRFYANQPNTASFAFGNRHFHAISNDTGVFFQDDFKLRPNLMLNLGLRWEYQSVYKERDNILIAPDGIEGAIATPQRFRPPDKAYRPDYNNFSPRLGFAWSLDSAGKNVIRGGAGLYYSPFALIDLLYMAQVIGPKNDLPFSMALDQGEVTRLGLKYPTSNAEVIPLVSGRNFPKGYWVFPNNMRNPYNIQWTTDYQRQLSGTTALQVGYVGNHSLKLTVLENTNIVNRTTGQRPWPQILQFQYVNGANSAYYHALQMRLQQRLFQGLTGNLSYNWARGMSYLGTSELGSGGPQNDEFCYRCDKAAYDRGQRIMADWIYEPPIEKWLRLGNVGRNLFGGWQLAGIVEAQTGDAINVSQQGGRPDTNGTAPYLKQGYKGRYQWLNPAAFSLVPLNSLSSRPIRPGNVGRNSVIGPGFWNVDLALSRNFRMREGMRLQVRFDMFNAFNHFNLGSVDLNLSAPATFGLIRSVGTERRAQLNARLVF